MPYARRTPDGLIDSLHRTDPGGAEWVEEDGAEVQAFLAGRAVGDTAGGHAGDAAAAPTAPDEHFAALDADFVRVIEDVIDTLILKNIINITDLPAEAQTKLFSRKSFRDRVNRGALSLFDAGELEQMVASAKGPGGR